MYSNLKERTSPIFMDECIPDIHEDVLHTFIKESTETIREKLFLSSGEELNYPNTVSGIYNSEWTYECQEEPEQVTYTATMNIKREDLIDLLVHSGDYTSPWNEDGEKRKSNATKHGRGIKQIKKDRKKKKRR